MKRTTAFVGILGMAFVFAGSASEARTLSWGGGSERSDDGSVDYGEEQATEGSEDDREPTGTIEAAEEDTEAAEGVSEKKKG